MDQWLALEDDDEWKFRFCKELWISWKPRRSLPFAGWRPYMQLICISNSFLFFSPVFLFLSFFNISIYSITLVFLFLAISFLIPYFRVFFLSHASLPSFRCCWFLIGILRGYM
jgi:hypothetical protein